MRYAALLLLWGVCVYARQGSIEGVTVNRAPDCPGFLYVPPKSETPIPALFIKPGQKLEGYKLEMTPRAVPAGRIVDEFGDPVPNVAVQAMPVNPADAPIPLFGNQNLRADDRGEFRIATVPGKYYLKVTPSTHTLAGIAPGKYRIAAADEAESMLPMRGGNWVKSSMRSTRMMRRGLVVAGLLLGLRPCCGFAAQDQAPQDPLMKQFEAVTALLRQDRPVEAEHILERAWGVRTCSTRMLLR